MTESTSHSGPGSGVNRRQFLKGSGAAAAATALHGQQIAAAQNQLGDTYIVKGATKMTLKVNGKSHQVQVEPRTTLLDALRYQLDLTGAKPVSMEGSSGASTVLVDGKPVTASTMLALQCNDREVTTAESFGGESPDPIPQAFLKHDAQQCGFCTPGFVIAVRAFLDKNPNASEEQIRNGLNGNICRCGTYANIIEAVVDLVKGGGNG